MHGNYFNIGAGRLQTEAGRDALRAQMRQVVAEGRRLMLATHEPGTGTPITDLDRALLRRRIAEAEAWLDRLGRLRYRNGALISSLEDFS